MRFAIPITYIAILFIAVTSLKAATPEKKSTDNMITAAVEREFYLEKGVFPENVDVSTNQGIVTLAGNLDNILAKQRAVKIAESVRGVCGVIDMITIIPISRSDEDIRKDILSSLLHDPATEAYQIAVSVKDAIATLTGKVGSHAESQLAGRIAESVKGTKEVRNEVTINYLAHRTDAEIDADVKARLQWDIWINGDFISPSVKNGKVTLAGTVRSAIGKSRAFEDAWVNGVTSVDNKNIKIEPGVGESLRRKLKYAKVSDDDIKQAVIAAIHLDPRISAFNPDVSVEGGVVLLGGSVGNLKAKTSAELDAKNIVGVGRVDNFIKVRPKEQLTDLEMKKQLTEALAWDPLLGPNTIVASVNNRIADLSGTVESNDQKAEAQDVASRTKGVVAVRNHLKLEPEVPIYYYDWPYYSTYDWISPSPHLSDEQIKNNIENGLSLSPYVEKDNITVSVKGGIATLNGIVDTRIGWSEVDKCAYNSGAIEVKNLVKVNDGAWQF